MDESVFTWWRLITRAGALTLLAGCLALGLPSAAHGASPPAPDGHHPQVGISIDTSTLEPELGERLRQALHARVIGGLRKEGFEVVTNRPDTMIETFVEMTNVESREYAISIMLAHGGEREILVYQMKCSPCSEARVVEQTVALLPAAARRLEAACIAPRAVATAPPPPKTLGPLGIIGVATLSGGVLTLVQGAVVINASPRGAPPNSEIVDLLPAGTALASIGTAVTVLGVAGLIVDLAVLDARRRAKLDKLDVSASFSPTGAGLQLRGRF